MVNDLVYRIAEEVGHDHACALRNLIYSDDYANTCMVHLISGS